MNRDDKLSVPENWHRIRTIDMHTEGEPLRVVIEGFPSLPDSSVLEYRRHLRDHHDHLRKAIMLEPRGHNDMYGVVLCPSAKAHFGVVFIHNEGYSTMCGHATIALGKLAVEMGWVERVEPVTEFAIEAPCGIISIFVEVERSEVTSVRFHNVPSFVVALAETVDVDGYGSIQYDLAFGGAFYAVVDARDMGYVVAPEHLPHFLAAGAAIKKQINASMTISHPTEADLGFLYGVIFVDRPGDAANHSRNLCVFADGEVDRRPTGSGVSARLAIHHARAEIDDQEWITIESIIGTTFKGRVVEKTNFDMYEAVIPEVEGNAFITGQHEFLLDPNDPLREGFTLGRG